jgi:FKBP-type peptidyl-prolyl cis-trans isomerase
MRAQLTLAAFGLLSACSGTLSPPHTPSGKVVSLPGLQYEVLNSGPAAGRRPLRSDDVMIRYVGRLEDGSIFSTSAGDGAEPTRFSVRTVIPGFSALVQLMRPGDRWRFIIPGYLGYGHEGRRFTPPEATLRRDIPPGSTLIFDVELVWIEPTPAANESR